MLQSLSFVLIANKMSLQCSVCGSTEKLQQLPTDEQYANKWKSILRMCGINTFPDSFRLCLLHFDSSHIFHFRNLFKWAVPKRELLAREFWEGKVNQSPKRAGDNRHSSPEHQPKRRSIQPRQLYEAEIALPPANKNDPAKDPLALPQLVETALQKVSTAPIRRSIPIIHVGGVKKTPNTKKSTVIAAQAEISPEQAPSSRRRIPITHTTGAKTPNIENSSTEIARKLSSTAPTSSRRSIPIMHAGGDKKTSNRRKSTTVIATQAEISPKQAPPRRRGIPIIHAAGAKTRNSSVITTPSENSPTQLATLRSVKIIPVAQVPASTQKSTAVPDFVSQDTAKLISISDVKYCTEQIAKQAIDTLKEDIDQYNQKNEIIKKKLDILKLKVRTYEKFIYKLVSKNIISIESAKEYSVMQSDIDRSKAKRSAQSAGTDEKEDNSKSADHNYV